MQRINQSGGITASFRYDAKGRRKSKTVNGTTTTYLYDGLSVIQELNGTTPKANYLPGLSLDEVFARTEGATTSYYLSDALNSTLALSDATGTLQTQYTYEPFGNTTQSGTANDNSFRYTGREEDGTGLYYYRALLQFDDTAVYLRRPDWV
jgi:YD repeat-containing protein